MRDLSDYKAEIFHRSEEKIKERKRNRNRALALCIPLCLVFAAVAFAKLPDIPFSNVSDESVSSNSDAIFVQVEVQNTDDKLQSSIVKVDATEISDIYLAIQSVLETDAEGSRVMDDFSYTQDAQTSENKVVQDSLSLFSSSEYEIIFTTVGGETFSYTLDGNKLTDNATNEKVTLSSKQCFELQSKLGITITWEEEK